MVPIWKRSRTGIAIDMKTFGAEGFECPRCCGVMELRMGQVFGAMAQRLFLSLSGNGRAPPKE